MTSLTVRWQLRLQVQAKAKVVHVGANNGAKVRGNDTAYQPIPARVRIPDFRAIANEPGKDTSRYVTGWVQGRTTVQTEGDDETGKENAQANGNQWLGSVQVSVVNYAENAQLKEANA